ncbi:MAG TPA: DUF4363 family protein [Firmicutes bacterium]|nr:DUF4363 family protein [Bacillota bacterium]
MKRLTAILSILILIISASVWGIFNLNRVQKDLNHLIEQSTQAVQNNDFEKAKELHNQLNHLWEEESSILVCYVRHNDLDEITKIISELYYLLEFKNTAEFCAQLNKIEVIFNHIVESEMPTLRNIF